MLLGLSKFESAKLKGEVDAAPVKPKSRRQMIRDYPHRTMTVWTAEARMIRYGMGLHEACTAPLRSVGKES